MTPKPEAGRDLFRTVLSVLTILLLFAVSIWILKPFAPALIWATTLVIATWPILLALERRLGGRRGLAVSVMTVGLMLVLVVPLGLAVASLVDNAEEIAAWFGSLSASTLPPPPAWIEKIPLVGAQAAALWRETAAAGTQGLLARLAPHADRLAGFLLGHLGNVGAIVVHFLLTVLVAAVLYARGESAAAGAIRCARWLAGEQGEASVTLAAQAIRGVALGVIVTALVQALMGGIGLAAAGVPSVAVLTAVMLFLGIAQLGPAPVLLPAIGWLFWRGDTGWGIALLVWSILVMTVDNVLRPALIRRGADLPFLLVFAGVLGGLLSLGVVGLFVGPVVLAVTYRLVGAWIAEDEKATSERVANPSIPG